MGKRSLLIWLIFGFIFGVGASSFVNFDFYSSLFLIFLCLTLFFAAFLIRREFESKKFFLILILFFLGFGFGVLRYEVKDFGKHKLDGYANKKITLEGVIDEEVEEYENYNRAVLKITDIKYPEKNIANGKGIKILVYGRQYPPLKYGDKVLIKGILKKPKNFTLDSGFNNSSFDWPAYLAKDDIFYEVFYPEIIFLESGKGSFVKTYLFWVKEKFLNNLEAVIPFPESSLAGGIVLGTKKSIPPDLKDDLVKAGVIHIIVLS